MKERDIYGYGVGSRCQHQVVDDDATCLLRPYVSSRSGRPNKLLCLGHEAHDRLCEVPR
jgi:hypothetical protein